MTVPSTARRRPPGRYDEPSLVGQRFLAVLLAALVVGLLVAIGSFLYDRATGVQVRGQVRTFDIRSDREVVMELEAAKPAGEKAYCVIRARGAKGLEVGRDIAVLDAEGTADRVVRGSFVLATTERAVTAELAGCTADPISKDDPAP